MAKAVVEPPSFSRIIERDVSKRAVTIRAEENEGRAVIADTGVEIGRCVKEAKETKFFLRMMAAAEPKHAEEARGLFREAKELHLIFASIHRK